MVFNEFSLPRTVELATLALEVPDANIPRLRYRVAKAEDDWFGDWSALRSGIVYELDQPGQVIQYQLLQPADVAPSHISEVKLEWSIQDSPSKKRWHFTQAPKPKENREIEALFRKNWKSWRSSEDSPDPLVSKAGILIGKVGERERPSQPIPPVDSGIGPPQSGSKNQEPAETLMVSTKNSPPSVLDEALRKPYRALKDGPQASSGDLSDPSYPANSVPPETPSSGTKTQIDSKSPSPSSSASPEMVPGSGPNADNDPSQARISETELGETPSNDAATSPQRD
jgi:hypothetical protein